MNNNLLTKIFGDYSAKEVKKLKKTLNGVLAAETKYQNMTDEELSSQTEKLKSRLANGETLDDILTDAFAVCREASWRVLKMKHYPVQIIGGMVLHQGRIAEMKTGEGKTLVETLPVYLNALSGNGVHVVTVNDYLAERDAEWMGRIYKFLNLSVGLIKHDSTPDERKIAYNSDITYGTNNEFGFDYLRDNMAKHIDQKVQRGHNFAIVDEVDSILIDEARTPLIISGQGDKSSDMYYRVNDFVKTLKMSKTRDIDTKLDIEETYDGDYVVNEKEKNASLTRRGTKKAERYFHIDNLMDMENNTLRHYIEQSIKAYGVMRKDIDYVINDDQIKIIDEFTGRIMEGRRYNQGLHQAIEAKEGVNVKSESKTLATITFQNYFRLYKKLSGMTGTALTEREEFDQIYKLDIVEIPTNKPVQRIDYDDVIYYDEKTKFRHVIELIEECHKKGQPVLVGTISIEKSEMLSELLKRKGIKHNVLNAKNHEKEAHIIAQAGQLGAVTIATNMAGRGTDIMLGGNPDFLVQEEISRIIQKAVELEEEPVYDEDLITKRCNAMCETNKQKVLDAGGLFVIGTERHESRRIDNQLRGRSGRQGDPGASKFFISLEDDLMRLFGGENLQNRISLLFSNDEIKDMPIETKFITRSIERAQKNIEGIHFQARKSTIQYDDVMNAQRKIIYQQRDQVLNNENVTDIVFKMYESVFNSVADTASETNDYNYLKEHLDYFLKDYQEDEALSFKENIDNMYQYGLTLLNTKKETVGDELFERFVEFILLQNVDDNWMDYIDAIDDLRDGIHLVSYAQKDPVVAFRLETYDMFEGLVDDIKTLTVKDMFLYTPVVKQEPMVEEIQENNIPTEDINPNGPCPCGSGKKYKKCCGSNNS